MKKIIQNVVRYPVDAQSNAFISAFVSTVLSAERVTAETILYCGRRKSACIDCNDCGEKPMMHRHHLAAYHDYVTISGLGLMWGDSDLAGIYDTYYKSDEFFENLSDRLDFLMKATGYDYIRLNKSDEEDEVFSQIIKSVDIDCPVLFRLRSENEWCVVTGYDTDTKTLYGIASNREFQIQDWFDDFLCAVVISGKTDGLPLAEVADRMISVLKRKENIELEREVMRSLDDSEGDRQKIAVWLNGLAGYSVESRWHGAECFTARMYHLTDSERAKELLCECTDQYLLFHDLCWRIWGLLGVGPETNYSVVSGAGERLNNCDTVNELKQLFAKLFEIDRNVLSMLKEISNTVK